MKQCLPVITVLGMEASVGKRAASSERVLPSWSGSSLELVESKLHPPPARPGIVPRTGLVDRLLASAAVPVVCVVAPPGYGKTTLLAQWAQHRAPRVGWVSVDQHDNDPAVLLTYIAAAVDRIEPIPPGVFRALAAPGAPVAVTVVPRIAAAVSTMTEPVALVLDDVQLLHNQACLDVVSELAGQLPRGSQLVLASRATPPLPVGLLRAQGRMVDVGVEELAMDQREARALLEGAGVRLADTETAELIRGTEGWPVGLYLAALAHKAGGSQGNGGVAFTGDDRFIADYLQSELLARLSREQVAFLTRTAVLDRMCGPLCDAVIGAKGSARVLELLEGSNLLLVPLDQRREWYRYHHLFRDLLRAELDRREPELVIDLHTRAAGWCEANGLPETAIDHAQAAGDADRAARLVENLAQPAYAGGRVETVRQWFRWFEDQGPIERYPLVASQGALLEAFLGQPVAAERWAAAAERGAVGGTPPDGRTMASYIALQRAFMCGDGVEQMRADVELHRTGAAQDGWTETPVLLLEGTSYLLSGQADRADPILAHAVDVGTHVGALPAASTALAERSLLAIGRDDWSQAETLANQALAIVQAGNLDNYIMTPLVHAVVARTALHRGDVARAQQHLTRAARLRPLLTYAIPWVAVQTLLELGRGHLALDDAAGARTVLRQAQGILQRRPDLGVLPDQAEDLRSQLDIGRGGVSGVSTLTTAELRLLPLLATHLHFSEIGQRLFISKHTVKTQAISIYRKLEVTSRSQAIERVQEIGLLER